MLNQCVNSKGKDNSLIQAVHVVLFYKKFLALKDKHFLFPLMLMSLLS